MRVGGARRRPRDVRRAPQQRQRLTVPPQLEQQHREVVDARRRLRVLGAERRFAPRERVGVQPLRLLQVALAVAQVGEVVERPGGARG